MNPTAPCGCNCSAPGKRGGCYHYIAGPPLNCLCACHPDSAAFSAADLTALRSELAALQSKLATEKAISWREGYKEGESDAACIETCGNLLRHIVEHCDALFVKGVLDGDRSDEEMALCGLLAGARSDGPCERCTAGSGAGRGSPGGGLGAEPPTLAPPQVVLGGRGAHSSPSDTSRRGGEGR